MNNNDTSSKNPYDVLGVPKDATDSQIRAAYRKLALRHHPDKQQSPEDKQSAHVKFAEISHAYEVLSDTERRRNYDDQQQRRSSSFYDDDMFNYHDPFQVFAQVFGQEFGGNNSRMSQRMGMQDPFFASPFGGGDPFFGGMFGGSMFGGSNDIFGNMQRSMDQMRRQQDDVFERMRQQQQQEGNNNNRGYYSSYSSSTTSTSVGPGGTRESVTTTTRNINGKQQTVTERTITKPDGSVERHVETTGDDDFPQLQQQQDQDVFGRRGRQLEYGAGGEEGRASIQPQGEHHEEEDHQRRRWPRFRSKRRKDNDEKKEDDDHDKDNDPPRSRY